MRAIINVKMLNLLQIGFFLYLITFLVALPPAFSQDIAEDLATPVSGGGDDSEQFTEYIKIIGNSKKIFIMTNNNANLNAGDFITLVYEKKCTARALVAKNNKELIGIKVMKIYSLMQWARIKKGIGLQILKGDDTTYCNNKAVVKKDDGTGIKNSEEVFKESSVFQDPSGPDLNDYAERNLKTDHLLSGGFGMLNSLGTRGEATKYLNFNGSYSYQFMDNIYIEGLFGQSSISKFPSGSSITTIFNMEGRLKYNFKTPYYTFFLPYVGILYKSVSSPTAGQTGDPATDIAQKNLIASMSGYKFTFGATLLRRLVPGWFARADISLEYMSAGFAIEF